MRVVKDKKSHNNKYKNNDKLTANNNNKESLLSPTKGISLQVLSIYDVTSVTRCLMGLMV